MYFDVYDSVYDHECQNGVCTSTVKCIRMITDLLYGLLDQTHLLVQNVRIDLAENMTRCVIVGRTIRNGTVVRCALRDSREKTIY